MSTLLISRTEQPQRYLTQLRDRSWNVPGGAVAALDDIRDRAYLGEADAGDKAVKPGEEFGCRPFTRARFAVLRAQGECTVVRLLWEDVESFLGAIPQFSYLMRRYRLESHGFKADWLRGGVQTW